MCELMGMSFNKEVNAKFSFSSFSHRGSNNPDGWGLAFYPDGSYAAQVIKEPVVSNFSQMAEFIKEYDKIRSSVYISHVRQATSSVCYANTHPFVRELRGREYTFAHNGNLTGTFRTDLSMGRWKPVGSTDSEFAFCHLMNFIETEVNEWNKESYTALEKEMRNINRYGHFNCLLSDGEHLFCYRDKDGYKGLCYTRREFPFHNTRMADEDMEVNLTLDKDPDESGYIISTRKLTNGEEWLDCDAGCLKIFRKGVQVFPEIERVSAEHFMQALRFIRTQPHRTNVFMIANSVEIKIWNIAPLIQKLQESGYVKQDSRDTVGPYDCGATYYTVPVKRSEIDMLLKEDEENCLRSYYDLNCIKAHADDRTPVCIKCKSIYKTGTTYCRKCGDNLQLIDTRIFDILVQLNKHGYPTSSCCSGHSNGGFRQYLIFQTDLGEVLPPDGFTIATNHGYTELRSMEYHKAKGITSRKIRERITQEDLENFAAENVDNLRKWARLLCEGKL